MKVVSWNCNMAFRRKWKQLLKYRPDILVIQECEKEDKFKLDQVIPDYNEFIWYGENENKGVAVISFNEYHLEFRKDHNLEFKYIIPISVTGPVAFTLYAIWAMPYPNSPSKSYVTQIWNAVNYYEKYLKTSSMLIGDWNSNQIWDAHRKVGNHSQLVAFLKERKIKSIYHSLRSEQHGSEKEPTLYLLKKKDRPYHMDYCFVSEDLFPRKATIEVGRFQEWIEWSDHMPLIISLEGSSNKKAR